MSLELEEELLPSVALELSLELSTGVFTVELSGEVVFVSADVELALVSTGWRYLNL